MYNRMSSAFVFAGMRSVEPPDCQEEASMRDVKPVMACRACLAVERPLRPLSHQLADTLASFVGYRVEDSQLFPKCICSFCCALLVKFTSFKDKCQSVQSTLQYMSFQDIPITLENIIQLADDSTYPNFKTAIFVNSMPEEFNPRHFQSIQIDGTIYDHVQCKSENNTVITAKAEDDTAHEFLHTQNDMICNDNNHSDYNDSSDDGGFLINLVRNNKNIDTKYNKNAPAVKNEEKEIGNEQSKSKIKSEKKKTIRRGNDKLKFRMSNRKDRRLVESRYDVKIVALSESEQIKQLEARKDSLNYKGAIFKCGHCYNGFNAEPAFRSHMTKHDPTRGDYECDICHLRYPLRFILNQHKTGTHIYNIVCNSCGAISKSITAAKHHFNWHKGIKYDCKICGKSFNKPNSVHGHMQWSHGGDVKCAICNKGCLGQTGLLQHMGRMHKKAKGAVCASCGVQFHNITALQIHRPLGDCDNTMRACAECGQGFISDQQLEDHKRNNHSNEWFCAECDRDFSNRDTYVKHMAAHLKPRFKPSESSGKPPRRRRKADSLNKPLIISPAMVDTAKDARRQTRNNSCVCEICGCHKKSKYALKHHLMMHTGEKPYQCDYCHARFRGKDVLQTHVISHMVRCGQADKASLMRYHCSICNMKFTFQANRMRHERMVHQQERKFSCDMCGSTYKWNESLKQHINTKHLGLPWPKRNRRVRTTKHEPQPTHTYIPN